LQPQPHAPPETDQYLPFATKRLHHHDEELTVVTAAQWNSELIAHLATERCRLRQAKVVRIWRPSTANQTGLFS
jgi:hypothetical protein